MAMSKRPNLDNVHESQDTFSTQSILSCLNINHLEPKASLAMKCDVKFNLLTCLEGQYFLELLLFIS